MLIMTKLNHRQMKRSFIDEELNCSISKNIKQRFLDRNWLIENTKKLKTINKNDDQDDDEQQYHCQVYLKLFPSTLKCSLDVILKSINKFIDDDIDDNQSILIAKTRIPKIIKPGVIRVRLVSSLFSADADVHEDLSLSKLETIRSHPNSNHFDKQFALVLKNNRIGPGPIGKLFVESLDPSNGSYRSNPPIFELNLNLASEHEILLTSSHQKIDDKSIDCLLECGCILSSNENLLKISDKCNLILDNMKLVHRLSEPLRCSWKLIGRELSPCFSEIDLNEINQRYFLFEGNYECTYQLLREWSIRDPQQANIRFLLTRLKLPFHIILTIHNDVIRTFISD